MYALAEPKTRPSGHDGKPNTAQELNTTQELVIERFSHWTNPESGAVAFCTGPCQMSFLRERA